MTTLCRRSSNIIIIVGLFATANLDFCERFNRSSHQEMFSEETVKKSHKIYWRTPVVGPYFYKIKERSRSSTQWEERN